jgi:hypothetical protein
LIRSSSLHKRSGLQSVHAQLPQSNNDGSKPASADQAAKGLIWVSWAIYNYIVFFSNQPCGSAQGDLCGVGLPTITEAINLSINFWFVTPLVLPSIAPVVHPALEGLFNFVIAFGALFFGFLSDGRGTCASLNANTSREKKKYDKGKPLQFGKRVAQIIQL